MKASNRRTVLCAVLGVSAAMLFPAPASAMGRSSASSTQAPVAGTGDRLGRVEAEQQKAVMSLQSEVEALRQELADLKMRVEHRDMASAE